MERKRLRLALELLRPEEWKLFEEFASSFLATQYPDLRTVASLSGDRGRDAELFSYDGPIETYFQYSIAKNWANKIRETAKRIVTSFPDAKVMIYVTNQSILSAADSLKRELREKNKLLLDIHDITWFLDRLDGDEHRVIVSENLARKVLDPYLGSNEPLEHSAPTLSTPEYQAALTFLQLQWEDDTREKGLTRLSFQALVRAVLRRTHSDSRMSRREIWDHITKLFPDHDSARIQGLVDSALSKLTKKYIRHWVKGDEFCLTHAESERVRERLAEIEVSNIALDSEIRSTLQGYFNRDSEDLDLLGGLCRNVIDHYLFERGEAFATAIAQGRTDRIGIEELQKTVKHIVESRLTTHDLEHREQTLNTIYASILELFTEPSMSIQNHLRSRADAYTLFAFLGRTPDVQAAVSKMFSHGTIWLDTSIILPLLAETLISNERLRRFTQMLKVAAAVGLELRVTSGVVEEIERHINRSLAYVRGSYLQWSGRLPFLVNAYTRSGQALTSFASWVENFEGQERPEDDLIEYLEVFFHIKHEDLDKDEMRADLHIRAAVREAWYAVHARRRDTSIRAIDDNVLDRLVRHDVENYLGVVERRRQDAVSPLGYSAWWLTLDGSVDQVERDIKANLEGDSPPTPVMSADFLVNYLSIGPIRSKVTKEVESTLPIALDVGLFNELPSDLLLEAERIRQEAGDLPEHIIRRRVRDCLDAAKRRPGHIGREGIQAVLDTITSDAASD